MIFQLMHYFVLFSSAIISIIAYDLKISYVDKNQQMMCYDYDGKFYRPVMSLVTGNWTGYLRKTVENTEFERFAENGESPVPPFNRDGSLPAATFHAPQKMATDDNGIIYLVDQININNRNFPRIRRIQHGTSVKTLCHKSQTTDQYVFTNEAGPTSNCSLSIGNAGLYNIRGIAVHGNNIYITSPDGGLGVVKFSISADQSYYTASVIISNVGLNLESKFTFINGIAVNDYYIFVADTSGNRVDKYSNNESPSTLSQFTVTEPMDVALDNEQNLYVTGSHGLAKITISSNQIILFTNPKFQRLHGITFVSKSLDSYLLVTDTGATAVYKIRISTIPTTIRNLFNNQVITLASGKGIAMNTLNHPTDAFADSNDIIFVVDSNNAAIKKIHPNKDADCPSFEHDSYGRIRTKALRPRCMSAQQTSVSPQICSSDENINLTQVWQLGYLGLLRNSEGLSFHPKVEGKNGLGPWKSGVSLNFEVSNTESHKSLSFEYMENRYTYDHLQRLKNSAGYCIGADLSVVTCDQFMDDESIFPIGSIKWIYKGKTDDRQSFVFINTKDNEVVLILLPNTSNAQ